ncbi:TetR/AcrR family transcriptional regulator [Streptomyces sp. JJ38]|uniref:TetR/AcrR family transcriptional regulator n=1 Tax=Streptomyces sp. JJ38 TaxID=2738128 RepID=UPI001C589306|nr:TetR family transcriptional regulator [Streptomyces sp. JJ38]MBW1599644.1 TetR family transcriptional regulator [Streptomyces sp. JJ38]
MARVSADVRRELLVEAAIRVMIRDGVGGATTRAVVAEAGMPLGAFHYCFRSKEELLENVIAAITGHTLDRMLEKLKGPGGLGDKLRAGLGAYWQHVLDHPDEHRVTYELTQYAVRRPGLAELAKRQYESYLEASTRVLEALAESCDVTWTPPLPVLARYTASLIDGLTLLYLTEGDAEAAGAALDLAATQVLGLTRPAD